MSDKLVFMSSGAVFRPDLPAVDERLVMPGSRYEIEDGMVRYVAPADAPHAIRHSKLVALLEAHAADDFEVACDMLTRTSEVDDMAPDASVFPLARDPQTGGRQIEHLAFEVASTESLSDSGRKAYKLVARGVRRVFAINVERRSAFEWSERLMDWRVLKPDNAIEDRALAVPLPVEALVSLAKVDDAIARALLAKHNPVIEAWLAQEGQARAKAKGKAETVVAVLDARGIPLDGAQRERILRERELQVLARYLSTAIHCTSVEALFQL